MIGGAPYSEGRVPLQDLADAVEELRAAFAVLEGPTEDPVPEHARVLILKLLLDEGVLSSVLLTESSWAEKHRSPSLARLWREIERVAADLVPEQGEPCASDAFRMHSVF